MPGLAPDREPPPPRTRNDAIDIVRGAVMVVMALDHARDFVGGAGTASATDLATTTVPLFLTRWITHFCAPAFVLLAGVAVALSSRTKPPASLARFLVSRGLWLVVLELTVVRTGWTLNFDYHFVFFQVIWALGVSMVLLAPFVFVRPRIAAVWGAAMVLGHDLLDPIHAARFGSAGWLWHVLHERGRLHLTSHRTLAVMYPLVPWVGVMALGYALGKALPDDLASRRTLLTRCGAAMTAAFVLVRGIDRYGDPHAWVAQTRGTVFTVLSFLDCSKYPPSLDYLLMTLGPTLLAMAALDGRARTRTSEALRTFGRVPLFYYLLHLYALQAAAFVAVHVGPVHAMLARAHVFDARSLPAAYLVWAVTVTALYPLCRWYAAVKQRNHSAWLSYL